MEVTYDTENLQNCVHLNAEERETHIYTDDSSGEWIADTAIQKDIRKFKKQGWELIGSQNYEDGTLMAAQFKAPRNGITIKNPNSKRELTDEQRQAAGNRLQNYRIHKDF